MNKARLSSYFLRQEKGEMIPQLQDFATVTK